MSDTQIIEGTIDNVYDARAMQVNGIRIGAPYKKDLADVANGALVPGASVRVEYTTRGKWNNASRITVTAGAGAPAASSGSAAPAGGAGTSSAAAKGFREPAELIRGDAVALAAQMLGKDLDFFNEDEGSAFVLVKTASIIEGYIKGVVTLRALMDKGGAKSVPQPQPEAPPAEEEPPVHAEEPVPTQEAEAANAVAQSAGDALDAFIGG